MSGAAGGSRIKKEDLKATIRDYRDNVLKPLGLDTSYTITGVRSRPEKEIFGDIDVVVSFPGGDKKELKQTLAKFIEQVNKIPEIPRKNNKKYFIHGSIVSILYPISGKENEYVQIDNIVTASEDEGKFTYKMLDLPAQEQGLTLGLVKAVFTELDQNQIDQLFKDLKITDIKKPGEGEEYDFNLNPSELSLKIVKTGTSEGKTVWKSNKFSDIKTVLSALGIDIEKDKFDTIVNKIKKFKNRRSIDRLKGMFKRNIRVGDAEVGLDKGIKKQQALDTVNALQERYSALVMELINPFLLEDKFEKIIAVFPGKFKPPHKDHLARINAAANVADEVLVIIGPKPVDSFTAEKTLNLFNLFKSKDLVPDNVKFVISDLPSPVLKAYKEFEDNPNQQYIGVFGKDDIARFKGISKLPNVKVDNFEEANVGNLSATDLRNAIVNKDISTIQSMMPDGINAEDYIQILTGQKELQEIVTDIEIICDNCGWCWSIVDGGDDLYVCHKCRYNNTPELKETWNLQKGIVSLTKYMVDNGMNISPLPKLKVIDNNKENADKLLGYTAYYNPGIKCITLYTLNRHSKDVLRSYSHEMIHHMQNLENRLDSVGTTNTNEDGDLPELEREAYEKGNMILRNWEDSIKAEKYLKEYKQKVLTELFEKDLPNIEKLNSYEYKVGNESDIEALYYFRPASLDPNDWEIHWKFTENNKNESPEAWKQVTATSYKVLKQFIEDKNPRYIEISGNTDKKTKIYKSKSYLEKLENIFNNQYKIDNSNQYVIYLKKIEEICKSGIKKRMETLNESYEQSLYYWQNGDVNSKSKIERWDSIKKKIQREVIQELYNIKNA